ncbi:MAG: response regulator [Bacteroidia bacterium]|nr:response regulator [Bacteroidia bacterium]MDW8348179.1 response regulator [Bacteroidia bacterium]
MVNKIKQIILCVDDEKVVLNSLRQQLQSCFGNQYDYEIAENAEEAWEIIGELQREGTEMVLIISDWLMPGKKGDEFLIELHKKYPKVITMMLTGHADESAVENVKKNANLFACIRKPWSKEELIENIEKAFKELHQ